MLFCSIVKLFFIFTCIRRRFMKTKLHSNISHINIRYYLKLRIPIMHRHFFRNLAQNHEYIQTHCDDRRNAFHFACMNE